MALKEQDWMMAWVSLAHAGTFLTDRLSAKLKDELGFGLAEQDLLKQVSVNHGELTMTQLAQRLYYSKAGITKMVDRLERDGLLERNISGTDRRAIQIGLTAEGKATLEKSKMILREFVRRHFRAYLSDEEVIGLGSALKVLLTGLDRYEGQLQHLKGGAHKQRPNET